jgi:HEAT repeat protein
VIYVDWSERYDRIEDIGNLLVAEGRMGLRKSLIEIRLAAFDPHPNVRSCAIELLGEFGTRRDIPTLSNFRFDRSWMVRCSAYSSLAMVAKEKNLALFQPGFTDPAYVVRKYAYIAYADRNGNIDIKPLKKRLALERNAEAREALCEAIRLVSQKQGNGRDLERDSPHK